MMKATNLPGRTPSRQPICTLGDSIMRWFSLAAPLLLFAFVIANYSPANADDKGEKKPAKKNGKESYLVVLPPAGGDKVKLADWQFTHGTRHFSLPGEGPAKPKSKTPAGPEYLEFREEKSTTFKNGILTLVPLTSIRKIEYDREKKTVSAVAINDSGEDITLVGSTKFVNNKITIEADAILDGLGSATVKFYGGIDKGLRSVAFPAPTPAEKVKGLEAVITADDKEKTKHTAFDVRPLFLVNGQYQVMPYVMFKKTVKIDWDKVASLRFAPPDDKKKLSTEYQLTLKDGAEHMLTILTTVELEKKKTMTFVGLIGRVPVGYKLFHLDAIYEYRAAEAAKKQ